MLPLAQPPRKDDSTFNDWMFRLWKRVSQEGGFSWDLIDKTGSNLTDIETRNHADLQNINTASYTHLTAANHTDLTDGGDSTLHYHASDRARANHTGTQTAETVTVLSSGAVITLQHMLKDIFSAGIIGGFAITDTGSGNISVAMGGCMLRSTNSAQADLYQVVIPSATALNIPLNTTRYIEVNYNAGAPAVLANTTSDTLYFTVCHIAEIHNVAGTLHIHFDPRYAGDLPNRIMGWTEGLIGTRVVTGEAVSTVSTTRTVAVTSGIFWDRFLSKYTSTAFDSAGTDRLSLVYKNGTGGWTLVANQTAWPNTQYDNGTGTLATLGNNKFGVLWVMREFQNGIYVQYGEAEYANAADAQLATVPATRPEYLDEHAFYIAKIVFEKSAISPYIIQDYRPVIGQGGTGNPVSNHENLSGLLGGAAGDHYHLLGTQASLVPTNTPSAGQVIVATSPTASAWQAPSPSTYNLHAYAARHG